MLCILCSVASCCTLPLAILRLATKSGQMAGFMLFWLILKNSRPKLWLNSPRNCWQGGPEVWWVVCVYAYVGFLLFLKFTSLYQNMCLSTYQINGIKIYIYQETEEGLKVRSSETYLYYFFWLSVTLVIRRPPACVNVFCHLTSWQQGGA